MAKLSVQVNPADKAALERMLVGIKGGASRAISGAINKTLKTTQTQAVKRVGSELNLKAARIKSDFTQVKARWANLQGALIAQGGPVGLINYGANQVKAGVSVKIKKTTARAVIIGAFKAIRVSKEHVYRREYKGPKKPVLPGRKYGTLPEKYRLPVRRLTGPRIEDIYGRQDVYTFVTTLAGERYADNVALEAANLLRRFG